MSRTLRHILVMAVLLSLAVGCSSTPKPVEDNPVKKVEKKDDSPEIVKKKEPIKVVYAAKAKDASNGQIDAAVAMADEGNAAGALSKLKSVLDDDGDAFLAAYNLGVLYDQAGETRKAVEYYEKALDIEPDFSPALLNLIRIKVRTGEDYEGVAKLWVERRPENIFHKIAQLEALVAAGRYDDTIDLARAVLKRDEANVRARYYLAAANFKAKRYRLSEYIATQALEMDAEDPELHFLRGQLYLQFDDQIRAQASFREAVELRPDYPEAQNALGLMVYNTRNFEEAEAAFSVAIKYSPNYKEAYLNLGNALKAQGRGDEAEAAYLKALSFDDKWADAEFALGALYLATEVIALSKHSGMERLESAQTTLKKARDLWDEEEGTELPDQFIAKAKKAIEILKAEEELKLLEQQGGGGDPFGDSGGDADPFGDEADPFGDEPSSDDPFEEGTVAPEGDDPFEEDGK